MQAIADRHFDTWYGLDSRFLELLTSLFGDVFVPSFDKATKSLHLEMNRELSSARLRLSRAPGTNPWMGVCSSLRSHAGKCALVRVLYRAFWPRFDVNVSTDTGHLLKSVFSIHPSTNRICVPFTAAANSLAEFKPRECPTVDGLVSGNIEHTKKMKHGMRVLTHAMQRVIASVSVLQQAEPVVVDLRDAVICTPPPSSVHIGLVAPFERTVILAEFRVVAMFAEETNEIVLYGCKFAPCRDAVRTVPKGGIAPFYDDINQSLTLRLMESSARATLDLPGSRYQAATSKRLIFTDQSVDTVLEGIKKSRSSDLVHCITTASHVLHRHPVSMMELLEATLKIKLMPILTIEAEWAAVNVDPLAF